MADKPQHVGVFLLQVVVERGVAEEGRIAVGGHSYGAFMAANLLAHAGHLFAAGIARSGAYNRCRQQIGDLKARDRMTVLQPATMQMTVMF